MASLSEYADELAKLLAQFQEALKTTPSEQALRKVYADFAGPEGSARALQKATLKTAANAEKRDVGRLGNEVLQKIEAAFEERLKALKAEEHGRDLSRVVDVTLPGRPHRLGHLHPITLVRREIEAIFAQLGFTVAEGPQIESDFHNFEALAMPKDHPARDMQDTFYVDGANDVVLRTHTSPVQIRTMLSQAPPVRIIAPGFVYRKDDDPTHSPMFTQVEGLCVDKGVTFGDLKGVLLHFVRRFFGGPLADGYKIAERDLVRLRPSFFPFTEPSAEVDMRCVFCLGAGCRTCKTTGWIEIGGAGMVDPEVFAKVGYDPEVYTGFAFGMGIDRMAMLRYGVSDIKLFFEGDVRFARQFR